MSHITHMNESQMVSEDDGGVNNASIYEEVVPHMNESIHI